MNCSFCSPIKRPRRIMTAEEFDNITTQIRPFSDYVYFHVKGEPLLHPDLDRLFDICYEKKLRVNLTTNGTLLPQKKELLFSKPALRQVNLSLHSFSEHDISEKNFDEEKYVDSLIEFAKEASQRKVITVLRLWNLDGSHRANEKSLAIMKKLEREFSFEGNLAEEMQHKNSVKLMPYTFISWDEQFEWPSLDSGFYSEYGRCHGMRDLIAILADGTVVPCCLDSNGVVNLGNVFEKSFEDIINSPRSKAITEGFRNQRAVEALCRACTYRTRFDRL